MNRSDILREAEQAVCRDRNATYGEPENNFAKVAALWRAAFGWPVHPYQVGIAMVLLKVARIEAGQSAYPDNYTDGAGYFAIAAEVATADAPDPCDCMGSLE